MTNFIIPITLSVKDLLTKLEELFADRCVFRGQEDSEYKLIPKIFRSEIIQQLSAVFYREHNIYGWNVKHPQIIDAVNR